MRLALAAVLAVTLAASADAAYFKGLWSDPTHPYTSAGALWNSKGDLENGAFTKVAVAYHVADPNDTIIPEALRAYIPPETWSLADLGYGGGIGGLGMSINLAATLQGYASMAMAASGNPGLESLSQQIRPGSSNLEIAAGPEWFSAVIRDSRLLPLNQMKGVPGMFVGLGYKFN